MTSFIITGKPNRERQIQDRGADPTNETCSLAFFFFVPRTSYPLPSLPGDDDTAYHAAFLPAR